MCPAWRDAPVAAGPPLWLQPWPFQGHLGPLVTVELQWQGIREYGAFGNAVSRPPRARGGGESESAGPGRGGPALRPPSALGSAPLLPPMSARAAGLSMSESFDRAPGAGRGRGCGAAESGGGARPGGSASRGSASAEEQQHHPGGLFPQQEPLRPPKTAPLGTGMAGMGCSPRSSFSRGSCAGPAGPRHRSRPGARSRSRLRGARRAGAGSAGPALEAGGHLGDWGGVGGRKPGRIM